MTSGINIMESDVYWTITSLISQRGGGGYKSIFAISSSETTLLKVAITFKLFFPNRDICCTLLEKIWIELGSKFFKWKQIQIQIRIQK